MHWHQLRSQISQVFQGHFTRCWDFRSALRVTNSTVVAVPIYPISDLYANSLWRFTLRKWSCEVLSLPSRRLQQTAVSCKRSNCNKIREKIVKVARLRFYPKTANNGFSVLSCRFARHSFVDYHLNFCELHQESLHCHQLEKELDDWCQY